jgi:hypothetical protein
MFLPVTRLFAQQKFALVIGNGAYTGSGMSKLANPVNDANDVAAALQGLGFTVDKVLDASLEQMESSIIRLKNRLSVSNETYGFFFYAGHGVQSNGENYLIPVGANIPSENSLRDRAVSVQWALAELNDAKNALNVVVLDACRDNPFSWKRSGTRGLSVVANQPADSIIVYATSAGSTAADGTDRNGLFTSHLLNNLKTPGLEVKEIFNRTGADVSRASNRQQIPAVYNQFFDTAYLGSQPVLQFPSVFDVSLEFGLFYKKGFLRLYNDTDEGLKLINRNSNGAFNDQKGRRYIVPKELSIFELPIEGETSQIYNNLSIDFDSYKKLNLENINVKPGFIYDIIISKRNGNFVYDIRESRFEDKNGFLQLHNYTDEGFILHNGSIKMSDLDNRQHISSGESTFYIIPSFGMPGQVYTNISLNFDNNKILKIASLTVKPGYLYNIYIIKKNDGYTYDIQESAEKDRGIYSLYTPRTRG